MTAWIVVLVAGVGSYLLRVSVVAAIDHIELPAVTERLAGYVVPAAFAGLGAAALIGPVGEGGGDGLAVGAAAAMTLAVAGRGRSTPTAFVAGLCTLWTVSALLALT